MSWWRRFGLGLGCWESCTRGSRHDEDDEPRDEEKSVLMKEQGEKPAYTLTQHVTMTTKTRKEQFDWKDSNLALFGSDTEKQVKKEAAESEPAWRNSGTKVGLEIWRIVSFKVQRWPVDDHGKFFDGDSYIILNTYKDEDTDALLYDVHFWIGKYSTQDEYGTAAYKTVELDTFHDDKPVQHREVQGHESCLFKSYFVNGITYLKGGADSGFRHVKPEEYSPRLLHFHGTSLKDTVSKEVTLARQKLNDEDVFVLDAGMMIYQINGFNCDKDERIAAMQYVNKLREERNGKPKVEVEDGDPTTNEDIMRILKDTSCDESESEDEGFVEGSHRRILRLSDADGEIKMCDITPEDEVISKELLDPQDVFIIDVGTHVYVWIGEGSSDAEKKNGMSYASTYLQGSSGRFCTPITVVGQHSAQQLHKELSW